MKITDFIFKYETARRSIARVGIFRVRVFLNGQNQIYVVLTELDENPGSSVTNTLEGILRPPLDGVLQFKSAAQDCFAAQGFKRNNQDRDEKAHFGGARKAICRAS